MTAKAWFRVIDPESRWHQIWLEAIENVAGLKDAIKEATRPKLDAYPAAYLTMSATKKVDDPRHAKELNEMEDLKSVLEHFDIEGGTKIQEAFAKNIWLFVSVLSGKSDIVSF